MNELFGLDPEAVADVSELGLVVHSFGPRMGRYAAQFPDDWEQRVLTSISGTGQLYQQRVKTRLRRLKEGHALIRRGGMSLGNGEDWRSGAFKYLKDRSGPLDGIISRRLDGDGDGVFELDELSQKGAADEIFEARPDEFSRVSKYLLNISKEVHFIDPFLDLSKGKYRRVIDAMLAEFFKGKCLKVVFWSDVGVHERSTGEGVNEERLRQQLRDMPRQAALPPGVSVGFNLIDKKSSGCEMHARYLLTNAGGIRFDQGFQELKRDGSWVSTEAAPIAGELLGQLQDRYVSGLGGCEVTVQVEVEA